MLLSSSGLRVVVPIGPIRVSVNPIFCQRTGNDPIFEMYCLILQSRPNIKLQKLVQQTLNIRSNVLNTQQTKVATLINLNAPQKTNELHIRQYNKQP